MYCTLDDLKKTVPEEVLVQLTDDEGLGAIKQERVDEAIAQADGEIDTYIGGRYSVPLAVVPAVIRRCSCDTAIYIIYKRTVEELPPTRKDAYRDALRILEQVRDGRMDLGITGAEDSFTSSVVVSTHFN